MNNSSFPPIVEKYLKKYASEKWQVEINQQNKFNNIVVVPALDEFENIKKLLLSLIKNDKKYFEETLIIFVINNTEKADEKIKINNRNSLTLLRNIIHKKSADNFEENIINSGLQVGVIDASSKGNEMPLKDGGVGFARKIGMDAALKLFDYSSERKKIIISLDADCRVDENYLQEIIDNFNSKNLSAAIINFEHTYDENSETIAAIICYEIFMRYYVAALKFAGSPYAFHTVGFASAFDYQTYIKAEGMNKRKAGEDFYFLEKAAKNVNISSIKSTTVYPSSRTSYRVPFGTGPRVAKFISSGKPEYFLYDFKSFLILKDWLNLFLSEEEFSPESYLLKAEKFHKELYQFLIQNKFESDFKKIKENSKNSLQLKKQKITWFDGFRTLKLIHHLRDNAFPPAHMFDALDQLFINFGLKKIERSESIPSLEIQREYLEVLKNLD